MKLPTVKSIGVCQLYSQHVVPQSSFKIYSIIQRFSMSILLLTQN